MKCLYKYPNGDIEQVFISINLEVEANVDHQQLTDIIGVTVEIEINSQERRMRKKVEDSFPWWGGGKMFKGHAKRSKLKRSQ